MTISLSRKPQVFSSRLLTIFFSIVFSLSPSLVWSGVLFEDDFEKGISNRWVDKGFLSIRNKTRYDLFEEENGNRCLRAISEKSYSGKGIFLYYDPKIYPILEWKWKIENIIEKGDVRRKEGDDHAAKIYIVFDGPSYWNPFDKRVLVYFWANKLPKGEMVPNAYAPETEMMIALQSSEQNVGEWKMEHVNIYEDYKKAFDEEPYDVEGIAFVADTDNTKEKVISYFDDIVIRTVENN